MLVAIDDVLAASGPDRHRDDFLVEQAGFLGRDGLAVRGEGVPVLFLARDAVVAAEVLGGLEHAPGTG
jgi:hypothetical protein